MSARFAQPDGSRSIPVRRTARTLCIFFASEWHSIALLYGGTPAASPGLFMPVARTRYG